MGDLFGNNQGGGSPFGGGSGGGNPFGGGSGGGGPFGGGSGGGGGFGGSSFGSGYGGMGNGTDWGRGMGGMGGGGRIPHTETRFALALFLATLIGGIVFYPLSEYLIFRILISHVNSIVFMGVYFAVFGLVIALAVFCAARISHLEFSGKGLAISGICILGLLLFGMLFEFLYELNFSSSAPKTENFVFAIDNSDSMNQNDPARQRLEAINELLSNEDEATGFAVYSFSDEVSCIRQMAPISDGIGDLAVPTGGGTAIVGVLSQIMTDMESGALPYDEGTQVVLLTDGYATDTDFLDINSVLKKYKQKDVSVSTVGLGNVDKRFLNNISNTTGGLSVTTDQVNELGNAMASVIRLGQGNRNLLSSRPKFSLGWLYAILRVLFLTLLGAIFIVIKVALTDESVNSKILSITSLVGIIVGAVIVEVGVRMLLIGYLARFAMVLLFSLTITMLERMVMRSSGVGNIGLLR